MKEIIKIHTRLPSRILLEMSSEIFIIFILILPFICSTEWTHSAWLDHHKKFHLKWRFDDKLENITFKTEVQTLGWVGFGLSPNGGMANSDIVIGWVFDSGQSFFHVRENELQYRLKEISDSDITIFRPIF